MTTLTQDQINDLWGMLLDNTERRIAWKATTSKPTTSGVPADDVVDNAGIGIAMADAIKGLEKNGVSGDNINPRGYVFKAGLNKAIDYVMKRREQMKMFVNVDEIKSDIESREGFQVADESEGIEEVLAGDTESVKINKLIRDNCRKRGLYYFDGITMENIRNQERALKSKKAKPARRATMTDRIKEAFALGYQTKKEVIDYFISMDYPFSSPSVVAAKMSHIRSANKKGERVNLFEKAKDIFNQTPNISMREFCEMLGNEFKYKTRVRYYYSHNKNQRQAAVA